MDIAQSSNRIINRFPPLNNTTPFTRVDGWSFLEVLEGLRYYVINTLVSDIDERNTLITEQMNLWFDQYTIDNSEILADIEATKTGWLAFFDQFMDDVVAQLEALNDQAVANLANNELSLLGAKLRELFMQNPTYNTKTIYVSPFGLDTNDGESVGKPKKTIKAAATALNGMGHIILGVGNHIVTESIPLYGGTHVEGASNTATTITSTHFGKAFTSATPGVRTYSQTYSNFQLIGPGKGTTAVGISLDSMTDTSMTNVTVSEFGVGIESVSVINGGAVYNNFYHVTANRCGTGFKIGPFGSNSNMMFGCRGNVCDIGVDITDANHTFWSGGSFELCGVGVKVTATQNAFADRNVVDNCRFESNTLSWHVTSANVRNFAMINPAIFDDYNVTDLGTRTYHTGSFQQYPNKVVSTHASAAGTYVYERSSQAGDFFPNMVVRDTATTAGSPVGMQVEVERAAGAFHRAKRAGETYWEVDFQGNINLPKGGYQGLHTRVSDPSAPLEGVRLYSKNVLGKNGLYGRFPTGAPVLLIQEP